MADESRAFVDAGRGVRDLEDRLVANLRRRLPAAASRLNLHAPAI
jgi:hypothetical protein